MLAVSKPMRDVVEQVLRVARRSAHGPAFSVLLTGETGTGKGLLARVLHHASVRRGGPFVDMNCAAVPASLLEDELFGHERGAFTGALAPRVGLIEGANGGTLFLDEVSLLSREGQAKLLGVLESRRVRRLGGLEERTVDVQISAATSADLERAVCEGHFLPELLHRLAGLWFRLPALRDRGEDVLLLADRFLERQCTAYRLPPKRFSEAARAGLLAHSWPGNVRELQHAVERAVLGHDGEVVELAQLTLRPAARVVPADKAMFEGRSLDEVERAAIEWALESEGGNVCRAAARLRVTRDLLRSRMERHGLSSRREAS
ncbi:MAG: sigma 54-interacting transcriptional regulator [Myxococcales bacterium]